MTTGRFTTKGDRPEQAGEERVPGPGSIQISDAQYRKLSSLIYRLCGIQLGEGKRELLKARLAKRLRATGCPDVRSYIQRLENDPDGNELVAFLDVITTNKTDFFREPQHFEFLTSQVLPKLDKLCGRDRSFRIWSAACSTGEEPYTIAMVLKDNQQLLGGRTPSILASDLSTRVLDQARRGVYAMERVRGIPRSVLTTHFQKGRNRWDGFVRVRPELRAMVEFRRINLMEPFRFQQPFHVIFCRNVMIYFDRATQEQLVDKFYHCLVPGGYLLVGHSESLTGIKHRLRFVRPAIYRREG